MESAHLGAHGPAGEQDTAENKKQGVKHDGRLRLTLKGVL